MYKRANKWSVYKLVASKFVRRRNTLEKFCDNLNTSEMMDLKQEYTLEWENIFLEFIIINSHTSIILGSGK